jgi:pimeloyl-ACP methyl ester carboxylesterase
MRRRIIACTIATLALVASGLTTVAPGTAAADPGPPTDLPIVFVHGGAGSAAQYRTQQMRFAANGYPNVVTAIDRAAGVEFNAAFDAFVDDVRDRTGEDQVFVVAHSLGTAIMNGYLNDADPSRAARVAKYISIDGAPANCGAIATECMDITAAGLGGQGHTQAVTSPESFVLQHQFLTGRAPVTTELRPQDSATIAGRVIDFPANNGPGAGSLELWEIDPLTGHRRGAAPLTTWEFTDAEDAGTAQSAGTWGPVEVDPAKRYEFALRRASSTTTAHYYLQGFTRSTDLIRLLSAPADAGTVVNTEVGDDHAAVVAIRYKEWWGATADGLGNDSLKISTTSTEGPYFDGGADTFPAFGDPTFPEQLPVEAITPQTAPGPSGGFVASQKIGVHIHDSGRDGVSSAAPIPYFVGQVFQTGVDVFMPADDPVGGTVHMVSAHRGDLDRPQVINTPNWASSGHRIVVEWNDYLEREPALPVVFVHGGSGSAAQYQSQAMRFAGNRYRGHIAAIDRNGPTVDQLDQLDTFVDGVLAKTGAPQVNLVSHSFGVFITNNYLSSAPERAAKVNKSIGVDSGSGATEEVCPGNVRCKGIWGQPTSGRTGMHGPYNNVRFVDQGHVQVMTSPESFAEQHRFFAGRAPKTTDVVPERHPTIAGRVVQFPANLGPGEATLRIYRVWAKTGQRIGRPVATFHFGASENTGDQSDGAWGPVRVRRGQHYELEIKRPGATITGHYYKEPFTRSNHFVRFLLLPEVALGPPITEIGPNHSAIVALRYKEMWAGHPLTADDSLRVGTDRRWRQDVPAVELVTDAITPASNGTIGLHMFDVGSDGVTDLSAPIPFWFSQAFQSGADLYLPAGRLALGTIRLESRPHDAPDHVQRVNVPNWPSDSHRSGIELDDYVVDQPRPANPPWWHHRPDRWSR